MQEQDDSRRYHLLFLQVMDRWESMVRLILAVLVCVLIVLQIGLHIPALQPYLSSIYSLDGIAVPVDNNSK